MKKSCRDNRKNIKVKKEKMEEMKVIRHHTRECNYELALELINNILEVEPDNVYAIHELGRLNFRMGEFEEAKTQFQKLVNSNAKNKYYAMFELGKEAVRVKDYDLAKYYYECILNSEHKDKAHAIYGMAEVEFLLRDFNSAKKNYQKVVSLKCETSEFAKIGLAKIEIIVGNVFQARKIINTIILEGKDKFFVNKVLLEKAKIEARDENYEQARKYFEKVISIKTSNYYFALFELARMELKTKNINDAKKYGKEIIKCPKFRSEGLFILSKVYHEMLDFEKEKKYLNMLNKEDNVFSDARSYGLGELEIRDKNIEDGKRYFEEITDINSEYYVNAKIELIYIAIKEEKISDALNIYKKLLKECDLSDNKKFVDILDVFLAVKTKKTIASDRIYTYTEKQIANYNEEEALKHIKVHTDVKNTHKSIFSSNIDINDLIIFCKNNLNETNLNSSKILDSYIIDYPNAGIKGNIIEDYIMVVTLPNSDKIITMYPIANKFNSELENEIEEIKVKKLDKPIKVVSQIDKFNQKYGIKNNQI